MNCATVGPSDFAPPSLSRTKYDGMALEAKRFRPRASRTPLYSVTSRYILPVYALGLGGEAKTLMVGSCDTAYCDASLAFDLTSRSTAPNFTPWRASDVAASPKASSNGARSAE